MRPDSIAVVNTANQDFLKHKKKRGKYVEKKTSKLSASKSASSRARTLKKSPIISPKACSPKRNLPTVPRRPPPTSFVNSVLDILSKTTTQPQNTDVYSLDGSELKLNADLEDVHEATMKPKDKKKTNSRSQKLEINPDKSFGSTFSSTPKKKLKSKLFNDEHSRPAARKELVVIQPKKRVDLVPSDCSSCFRDGLSWMSYSDDEDVFINKELFTELPLDIDYENNQVVKEINEGKKLYEEKSKHDNDTEKGPDKTIYNFFVDVLNTIKPDLQKQSKKACQLKDSTNDLKNLEIDENVANKLAFTQKRNKKVNIYGMDDELSDSPAEHFEIEHLVPKRPIIINEPVNRLRRKSKSFALQKPPRPLPQTSSFSRKSYGTKNSKKKRFLAMLRQKLLSNIDHEPQKFEEPQSFYEALKLMVSNKTPAPRVRFQGSKKAHRFRDATLRKPRRLKEDVYDVRYPIEAEVDSRYTSNIYSTSRASVGSLQVYGEDYLFKNQEEFENDSNTTDLCNRFSIASFFGGLSSNMRSKSSPTSVTRRTIDNRSSSPFSGRSSKI